METVKEKYRVPFRFITLRDDLTFSVSYCCRTCGYHLGSTSTSLTRDQCIPDSYIPCPCCDGGLLLYPYATAWNPLVTYPFDVNVFRVATNGQYLREAYMDACSEHICQCDHDEAFIAISANRHYPFICAGCLRLIVPFILIKMRHQAFGFLRHTQIEDFIFFRGLEIYLDGERPLRNHFGASYIPPN